MLLGIAFSEIHLAISLVSLFFVAVKANSSRITLLSTMTLDEFATNASSSPTSGIFKSLLSTLGVTSAIARSRLSL